MSAHPCPCGHATLVHGADGCSAGTFFACGCAQTFKDLTAGRPNPLLPAAKDSQVGGTHYQQHSIQPWDIWSEYGLNAFEGAVLKYLLRRKGDRVEDLKKARHTLDRLIEIEEGRG